MTEIEQLEIQEPPKNFPARILGRLGLVYGAGLAEFGLKHVGWGIPLHRRSTLEANAAEARRMMEIVDEVHARSVQDQQGS